MNVEAAWRRGFTGKQVVVSILDDGIERDHPDLFSNYVGNCLCLTLLLYMLCVSIVCFLLNVLLFE